MAIKACVLSVIYRHVGFETDVSILSRDKTISSYGQAPGAKKKVFGKGQ